ncbi:hypothetical protein SDC9_78887 [bioreactor metagenome]|uniref:Uncharacterized protein n=1 Tax=bioreactor metagenome TaxID=1076179 RepID=A0A644YUR3_9ZZZZ
MARLKQITSGESVPNSVPSTDPNPIGKEVISEKARIIAVLDLYSLRSMPNVKPSGIP